jgi:hypothetical protein
MLSFITPELQNTTVGIHRHEIINASLCAGKYFINACNNLQAEAKEISEK